MQKGTTMNFKKRIAAIFAASAALILTASLCSCGAKNEIDAFDPSAGEHVGFAIDEFSEAAAHFKARGPFNSVKLHLPGFSDNIGSIDLRLYRWDTNYEVTLKGDPVLSKTFVDFTDNAYKDIAFDSQPAGEYLFLACVGYDGVGVWTYSKSMENVDYYQNGTLSDGALEFTVVFDDAKNAGFDPVTPETYSTSVPEGLPDSPVLIENVTDISEYTLVDGLGRGFDAFGESPESDGSEKAVGIFYWPWHYKFTSHGAYSINDVVLQNPDAINDYDHPAWDMLKTSKGFWNEPLFGYYSTLDKWVVRRHAEMLADADIDCVIFDCTNGSFTWRKGYETMAEVFLSAIEDGVDVPKFVFMCNFIDPASINAQLNSIFEDFYSDPKYAPLWFWWKGRPLILADSGAIDRSDARGDAIYSFFTFRKPDHLYFRGESADSSSWGWLSVYPQTAYRDEDGKVEEITVGVAQNANDYGLVAMNDFRGGVHGRSYTDDPGYSYTYTAGGEELTASSASENSSFYGLNFQEQWDRAAELDPEFVFVTGWNEWAADRYEEWQGSENAFPDTFNDEYSRDIEPTKGPLSDYYYTQLCINVRRFKGSQKPNPDEKYRTIALGGGDSQWDGAKSYRDYRDGFEAKETRGYLGNKFNRRAFTNDIVCSRVACDEKNVYFRVETAGGIVPPARYDEGWMRLFIDIGDQVNSWCGFEYSVYTVDQTEGDGMSLVRSDGAGAWSIVGIVDGTIGENYIEISIPREYLEIGDGDFSLSFKWIDGVNESDPLTVYLEGDAAPGSRFAYGYAFRLSE